MGEAIRAGDIPGVQLRRRRLLPLAPAVAWGWLTEPERLARWLADAAEPGPEGTLLRTGEEGRATRRERLRPVASEPPNLQVLHFERLDAGWPIATRLTVRLHPRGEGCEVDVLHEGFQRLPLSTCLTAWEDYRRRWRDALERLAAACDREPLGPP